MRWHIPLTAIEYILILNTVMLAAQQHQIIALVLGVVALVVAYADGKFGWSE